MRHLIRGRKLGRNASHRKAMFKNMAVSLIKTVRIDTEAENAPKTAGRITTTLPKAKELRPFVEKLITLAKKAQPHLENAIQYATDAEKNSDEWKTWRGSEQWNLWNQAIAPALTYRRRAFAALRDNEAVDILFNELVERFEGRAGGYTRIVRLATVRLGDAGTQAIIEFVGKRDRTNKKRASKLTVKEASINDSKAQNPPANNEKDIDSQEKPHEKQNCEAASDLTHKSSLSDTSIDQAQNGIAKKTENGSNAPTAGTGVPSTKEPKGPDVIVRLMEESVLMQEPFNDINVETSALIFGCEDHEIRKFGIKSAYLTRSRLNQSLTIGWYTFATLENLLNNLIQLTNSTRIPSITFNLYENFGGSNVYNSSLNLSSSLSNAELDKVEQRFLSTDGARLIINSLAFDSSIRVVSDPILKRRFGNRTALVVSLSSNDAGYLAGEIAPQLLDAVGLALSTEDDTQWFRNAMKDATQKGDNNAV